MVCRRSRRSVSWSLVPGVVYKRGGWKDESHLGRKRRLYCGTRLKVRGAKQRVVWSGCLLREKLAGASNGFGTRSGKLTVKTASETAIEDNLCSFAGVLWHLDGVMVTTAGATTVKRTLATHSGWLCASELVYGFRRVRP